MRAPGEASFAGRFLFTHERMFSIALGALAMTTDADAKARVGVYFGVPFYDYQVNPGWRYYDGYGWYEYGRYGDFRRRYLANNWMSCGQARRLVDRFGHDRVRTIECSGRTFTFSAVCVNRLRKGPVSSSKRLLNECSVIRRSEYMEERLR